jgi:hypothetical protein
MQQRASESIGALAAALAKAQIELVNPEKSLVATIREEGRHGREQTFRYAPLSAGLEITRKVLGQHEIATLQTTSIDQAAGLIKLTTVLAHSSGEWIASDWPVCPVGETASPRRMGAALTYARRYALFALVGIAGEDDLDAPDLQSPMSEIGTEGTKVNGSQLNGGDQRSAKPESTVRAEAPKAPTANPVLGLHASAKLRERLIVEIGALGSSDDAAKWVRQSLAEKNRLRASDAAHVEANFETKLAELATTGTDVAQARQLSLTETRDCAAMEPNTNANHSNERAHSHAIDKSALALPEPRRVRDRDHIRSIIQKPCLVCGRRPSDPHHLRFAQSRALSSKVSDQFTVPLCRGHHRELHRCGDEAAWWRRQKIDALGVARLLWLESHPLAEDHEVNSTDIVDITDDPTGSISRSAE